MFKRLTDYGLKIKFSDCHFAQSILPLFGQVTTPSGVQVGDVKISAIKGSSIPTTPNELRSFLGLAG